jgi:hypothetical protein
MKHAGLTDDPKKKRESHGNPQEWYQIEFATEKEARHWEKLMMAVGYQGGSSSDGWKYGYIYAITNSTSEKSGKISSWFIDGGNAAQKSWCAELEQSIVIDAMKHAGLTDDPKARREAHGNPIDWNEHQFENEEEARAWEKIMLASGYNGGTARDGWRYGYTFTITRTTKQ